MRYCKEYKCRSYAMTEQQTYVLDGITAYELYQCLLPLVQRVERVVLHGRTTEFTGKKHEKSMPYQQDERNTGISTEQLQQIAAMLQCGRFQGGYIITAVQLIVLYENKKLQIRLPYVNGRLVIRYKLSEWCDNEVTAQVQQLVSHMLD